MKKSTAVPKPKASRRDEWKVIEKLLPEGWEQAAFKEKAFKRRGEAFKTPADLLRVLLFHATSTGGTRTTMAALGAAGIAVASGVGLLKRLLTAGPWLAWITAKLCQAFFTGIPRLANGLRPRAVDGTTIQGPASKGTDYRLHYSIDLLSGNCDWHELTSGEVAEGLERMSVRPGDVILADRNYLRPTGARHVVDAQGHVLTRARWTHPAMTDLQGQPFKVLDYARTLRIDELGDTPVYLVDPKNPSKPIRGRMLALRLPAPIAAEARRRLHRSASRKQRTPDPRSLKACDYVFIFTTIPIEVLDAKGVFELYRTRWQIELVFKRHKQILRMGHLPHKRIETARSCILAKLVIALLLEKIHRNAMTFSPWGYQLS